MYLWLEVDNRKVLEIRCLSLLVFTWARPVAINNADTTNTVVVTANVALRIFIEVVPLIARTGFVEVTVIRPLSGEGQQPRPNPFRDLEMRVASGLQRFERALLLWLIS